MGWTEESLSFKATGTTTRIQFASLTNGAYGPALDDISLAAAPSIQAVPTPAAAWSGLGLLGMMGVVRGRRSHRKV